MAAEELDLPGTGINTKRSREYSNTHTAKQSRSNGPGGKNLAWEERGQKRRMPTTLVVELALEFVPSISSTSKDSPCIVSRAHVQS